MPASPLLSVVMSVFNSEQFLAEAVESILNQSFSDFEFIVINDGSTDGSGAILETYQKKDSRLRVYHQENRGVVESANCGCRLAQGKYIARMDSDDIAIQDRLMWQVEFMEKHTEVAVLGGAVDFIDAKGRSIAIRRLPAGDRDIKSALLRNDVLLQHPAVLIRRDALVQVGGYRGAFSNAEDFDLWLRMAEYFELANLETVVIKYRLHPNQVSNRKVKEQALSTLAARASARSRRDGMPDLLNAVEKITPAVLADLGVSEADQQNALVKQYLRWIGNMSMLGEHSAAFEQWSLMIRFCRWEYVERRLIAEAWLTAAPLYWRQGRFLRSLHAIGRAVVARPVVAGRPLKPLLRKMGKVLKSANILGVSESR